MAESTNRSAQFEVGQMRITTTTHASNWLLQLAVVLVRPRCDAQLGVTQSYARLHRRRSVSGSAPVRSLKPREVVQEIYGWLLGHYAVRHLMFTAAQQAGISPLRLGFTGTLKVLRRAISDFQNVQPEELPFFSRGWLQTSWLKKFLPDGLEVIRESILLG